MKKSTFIGIAAIAQVIALSNANAVQVDHGGKTISDLQVDSYNGCIFFQLAGVTEANPVVPGNPWFAIDQSQPNAKELYAMLLSSRIMERPIPRVATNGATACGYARVMTIDF